MKAAKRIVNARKKIEKRIHDLLPPINDFEQQSINGAIKNFNDHGTEAMAVIKAISFNSIDTDLGQFLLNNKSKMFNVAGKLSLNEWKGEKNVEFIIDDISVIKNQKNQVPSSIGQDTWFSSMKEGFDSPWDRQKLPKIKITNKYLLKKFTFSVIKL